MSKPHSLKSIARIVFWIALISLIILLVLKFNSLPPSSKSSEIKDFFTLEELIMMDDFEKVDHFIDSLRLKVNEGEHKDLQLFEVYISLKKEDDYGGIEAIFVEDTTLLAEIVKAEYFLKEGDFIKSNSIIEALFSDHLSSPKSRNRLVLKLIDLKSNWLIKSRANVNEFSDFVKSLDLEIRSNDDDFTIVSIIKMIMLKAEYFERKTRYKEALATAHMALSQLSEYNLSNKNQDLVADIYSKLATILHKDDLVEASEEYYLKAIDIYQNLKNKESELSKTYANLGDYYDYVLDSVKAEFYLRASIDSFQFDSKFWNAYSRQKIGIYFYDNDLLDSSKIYLKKSLDFMDDFDDCLGTKRISYDYLSSVYLEQENLDSAYFYLNRALQDSLCLEVNKTSSVYVQFLETKSSIEFDQCQRLKDTSYCHLAIEFFNRRKEYTARNFGNNDQLHFTDFMVYHSNNILRALWEINKIHPSDQVFDQALKTIHEAQSRTLKSSIYEKEYLAKSNLLNSSQLKMFEKNEERINHILNIINDFKVTQFPDSIIYKELYDLYEAREVLFSDKEDSFVIDIEEFNKYDDLKEFCINNQTQIFQYHFTAMSSWIVYLSPDTILLDSLDMDSIQQMASFVNDHINNIEDSIKNGLIANLSGLYDLLIEPYLSEKFKDIIIIPDGELQNCPFEALIMDSTDTFKKANFFINDHNISYGFDLNNIADYKPESHKISSSLIISYTDEETLEAEKPSDFEEIRNTYKACQRIDSMLNRFNSKFFSGEKALSKYLIKNLDSDIIHIGLHGNSNKDNRFDHYLGFRDSDLEEGKFYTYHLQNRKTKSKLVVLAACDTGVGKYTPGAGTYSISQDFLGIGAQSVVKTLWKVRDKETSHITEDFYENLESDDLTNSLSEAKRNFIDSADEKHIHPYYWSGYSLEGNPYIKFQF